MNLLLSDAELLMLSGLILLLLIQIIAIIHCIQEGKNKTRKMLWIIFLSLAPIFSLVIYFLYTKFNKKF
jgi:RsiW-degrading membrane proteinase PrsW (M82 family)